MVNGKKLIVSEVAYNIRSDFFSSQFKGEFELQVATTRAQGDAFRIFFKVRPRVKLGRTF